ncbi:glycosyl transferase [Salinimicrobium marinum]|uniref:Glycosyl transferase n=1 Tax=Salinimicrobium marinum TaxID=680283 RepID=A0A918SJW6_9FLAO|nr:glycosyltransferase family 1 protein [Salinimicrobium marinum]GHA43880.1 glycosyl transferase [Salinimicrobium marinum]
MPAEKRIFLESHNINNLYSGFGQFNYWLIKNLTEHNQSFQFTAYAKNKSVFKDFGGDLKFQRYYSFNRYKTFRLRKKYDLWHSLNQNSKIEPYSSSMPYLMTLHDVIFMEKDPIEKVSKKKIQLLKEKINRSQTIIFISEHAKRSANHFFEISEAIPQPVIYNGNPTVAQPPVTPPKVDFDLTKPYLFCIGQFLEMKNFHSLIGMLSQLNDLQLIIAGNKDKPYGEVVKQEIKKYKLQDRVFLAGKISEKDKHYYFQNCEAFVFPSLFEGFGMPPIEAMAYGKPVFLANRTSLPEIGGEYAFYWDQFDADYMVGVFEDGMNKFQKEKDLYTNHLKKRAESFNWDKTAKEYLQVYDTLLIK